MLSGEELSVSPCHAEGELFLNIYARLKQKTLWADAGFAVAHQQFHWSGSFRKAELTPSKRIPKMKKTADGIWVTTRRGQILIDNSGALAEWIIDGKQMLKAPLEPYFWKPVNDNQSANGFAQRLGAWRDAAEKRELKEMSVKRKGVVVVKAEMKLPVGADYTLTYTINAEGEVKVDADYKPTADNIPLMPKFGMRLRLPIDFQQVDWYGRGCENEVLCCV